MAGVNHRLRVGIKLAKTSPKTAVPRLPDHRPRRHLRNEMPLAGVFMIIDAAAMRSRHVNSLLS